ncbi:MAG: nucleotide exchange factor GrpE [Spartobacteria bacterium]|nr:nucleotide exchange factor GrpE [Spartobacteria bacterium]
MSFWKLNAKRAPASSMCAWKAAILDDVTQWLQAQPDELPVPSTAEDDHTDLLSIVQELTALRQEVRGMGRSSARLVNAVETSGATLHDAVTALTDQLAERETAAARKLDEIRDNSERIKRDAMRPMLLEIADIADALREVSARKTSLDWPAYIPGFIRQRVEASLDASVDVLNVKAKALLERYNLHPMVKVGDTFDASFMNAVSVSQDDVVEEGCVSAIIRQAFTWGTEQLRMAEVVIEEHKK